VSDPQDVAESLDDEELPEELIPDKFIEPEDWDGGAGADEDADDGPGDAENDIGQEREGAEAAEEAAMHVDAPPSVET
jgi:hypothetical protein